MAGAPSPVDQQHFGEAYNLLSAATGLLEAFARFLRQFVHAVGWLVLLRSAIILLVDPHISLDHLVVPGAGVLAVLQGALIGSRRWREVTNPRIVPDGTLMSEIDPPADVDTLGNCAPATQGQDGAGLLATSNGRVSRRGRRCIRAFDVTAPGDGVTTSRNPGAQLPGLFGNGSPTADLPRSPRVVRSSDGLRREAHRCGRTRSDIPHV